MSIVKKFVKNPEIAKDLTQEIFIKAYLSYGYYTETGKIRAWLSVIADNKLKNYYKSENRRNAQIEFIPLEDSIPSREQTPEFTAEQNEFTEQIVKIINTLPQKQRDAVFYSVIHNYTEKEIAAMRNIPVGSVKSAKHYGLEKVKKIILEKNLIGKVNNNMNKLANLEAYALLYQYAKNQISDEDKAAVEAYIKTDAEAANIAEALRNLHGKLTYAKDDETTHYNITFFLRDGGQLIYGGVSYHMENHKEMNEYLEKYDGCTPPEGHWFELGSNGNPDLVVYDNDGNKLEMNIYWPDEHYHRTNVKKMKKIFYPVHWRYTVSYDEPKGCTMLGRYEKLKEAPNLYKAITKNYFGSNTAVKSALYLSIPEEAGNIRMIRGNGVIDCGKYKFVYADRYVIGDEGIFAECTFNLDE